MDVEVVSDHDLIYSRDVADRTIDKSDIQSDKP